MTDDITQIIRDLREVVLSDDHDRGCMGRCYSCSCGYDDRKDKLATTAAAALERLSAERASVLEECAKIAEEQAQQFLSHEYASNQPFGSTCERFACGEVAKAIRELIPVSVG